MLLLSCRQKSYPLPLLHLTCCCCCCCPAGKGATPAADDIPDDELAEDIYAGEEDELRPERPDKVSGAAAACGALNSADSNHAGFYLGADLFPFLC
jgi:hypothetical protein